MPGIPARGPVCDRDRPVAADHFADHIGSVAQFDSLDHPGHRVVRVEHQRGDPRRRGQASGEQLGGAGVRSEVVDRFRSSAGAVDGRWLGRLGQQVGHHCAHLGGVPSSTLVEARAM